MNQASRLRVGNSQRARQNRQAKKRTERLSRRKLLLEQLEDRALMTTFNVTASVTDGAAGSLRDAIVTANSNGQDDTINLAAGT